MWWLILVLLIVLLGLLWKWTTDYFAPREEGKSGEAVLNDTGRYGASAKTPVTRSASPNSKRGDSLEKTQKTTDEVLCTTTERGGVVSSTEHLTSPNGYSIPHGYIPPHLRSCTPSQILAISSRLSTPPRTPMLVCQAIAKYKRAGELFARLLYQAAEPHCSRLMWIYGTIKNTECTYYAEELDENVSWTFGISRQENYLKLAQIVVENAPDKVNATMMRELRRAFKLRRLVDWWHSMRPGYDSQGWRAQRHQSFTRTLRQTGWILHQVFQRNYPNWEEHMNSINEEVDRIRLQAQL